MNDIVKIERHDFNDAISEIKKFTEETPAEISLNSVVAYDDHCFGLWSTSHEVTGSELNDLTEQIQNYLIKMNKMDKNFIDEFENVYKALDALDKDYINAILIAMNGLQKNNDDIAKAVNSQKKIIQVLKNFKEELEKLKHLENIDLMWNRIDTLSKKLENLDLMSYRVESLSKYAEGLGQENKELKAKIEEIEEKYVSAETMEATNKKAKTAYILAGISLALVIVQFIVMATKVL